MAIDRSIYINKIKPGLKADKDFNKFFYRFKIDDKTYYSTFDYSDKNWNKNDRKRKAEVDAIAFRDSKKNPQSELDENIKVSTFIDMHFEQLSNTTWKTTKINHYNKYLKKSLGSKKMKDVKQMHIKTCIKEQEEFGLAARTVKTTLEILNPLFKEAIANRLLNYNPCDGITIKIPKTKKKVSDASKELKEILEVVNDIFKNDPYYLSFYLFAITARRKSEILKLKWENINFDNNTYLIEDTKNEEHQIHNLPNFIKDQLELFKKESGWVFESPTKPGQHLGNVEKQTKKIKAKIPNFTLHRLRNITVSAMAQQGISATLMSAALGHNNVNTLAKYLTLGYEEGSKQAAALIENLTNKKKS